MAGAVLTRPRAGPAQFSDSLPARDGANVNLTKGALDGLAAQAKKGIVCVRSTRVATGRVGRNVEVDDDKLALVASDDLNPQKARVLLRLALLKPRSLAEIQRLFAEY
jgi:L-asparaginase